MYSSTDKDQELIAEAQQAIRLNYDEKNYNHTVGAAIRCKSGKIYIGVNVYSLHGACAEQVAIGTAITHGERDFETIVAVRGKEGEEIGENKKIRAMELLEAQPVSRSACSARRIS